MSIQVPFRRRKDHGSHAFRSVPRVDWVRPLLASITPACYGLIFGALVGALFGLVMYALQRGGVISRPSAHCDLAITRSSPTSGLRTKPSGCSPEVPIRRNKSVDGEMMSIKLNNTAYEHAKRLIKSGHRVLDDRDAWSEHRPSTQQENEYIAEHGHTEYAHWYLGIDDEHDPDTKGRYKFPYGDFENVHRCGVLSAESRAAQYKHDDIEAAAAHLHGMLDAYR